MMGFARNSTKIKPEPEPVEVEKFFQESPDLKKSNVSFDQSFIEVEDFSESFLDSILNFDDWVEDNPKSLVSEVMNSEKISEIKIEKEVCEPVKLGDLIQEGMGRVSLTSDVAAIDVVESSEATDKEDQTVEAASDAVNETTETEVKNGSEKEESKSDDSGSEEEESSSSSSDSSSSSSDDDDEEEESDEDETDDEEEDAKKVKCEVEMEEGEIRDVEVEEMVAWSDDEDGDAVKGPIRSKNEVQDLPPVPPVNVTLEPHHQTLPVGVVLSIMGAQVIVEGVEKHNPLSEGSILWITESRSPLGIVDEIFGPVKNPYYMVRYNSETEVPSGIQQGSLISFVSEFADHVLNNNNNLYKKGYDASGENDEELDDEVEFSDDEKEAEYRKMMRMAKRGSADQKNGHAKKDKKSRNRGGNWKNDHQPSPTSQTNGFAGRPVMNQAFPPSPHASNLAGPGPVAGTGPGPSSGVWSNGFPSIPPQNMGFPPNGFPPNGFPFMQPNFQNLMMPNLAPFHPQFNAAGQMYPNFVQGIVPPNFNGNPAFSSWPTGIPPNGFNQLQGPPMVFQGGLLPSTPIMNALPQGVAMANGVQMENNGGLRPPMANVFPNQESNGDMRLPVGNGFPNRENNGGMRPPMGNGNGFPNRENNGGTRPPMGNGNGFPNRGGRKGFQRGGGRFRGGRGGGRGQQSR